MAGLNNITEMGKQGMLVAQASIQVTGKNIANVNTEGYSRVRLDINPILPEILAGFSLGSAINGDSLRRIREDFTDRQFWNQNSLLSQYTSEETLLEQLEGVLPVDNETGLRSMLEEFWGAWNNLANDPESGVARTSALDKAETLVQTFNRVHKEFASYQASIAGEIHARITDINRIAHEIAKLNEVNPGDNFDLEDHRNRLIDDLSSQAEIQVVRNRGSVSISIGGIAIVSGRVATELSSSTVLDGDGIGSVTLKVAGSERRVTVNSGELGALLNVHNDDIPDVLSRLDTLATTIATEVNALHRSGFNLSGITGLDFFAPGTTTASGFQISSIIRDDSSLIASSQAIGEPGNGALAQAISNLSTTPVIGDQSISEFQRTMVAQIGTRIQEARFLKSSQEKVVSHLALRRESVSGVSIEEEMTKLMQFEQSFATASRLVRTADDLIRTLLQMV